MARVLSAAVVVAIAALVNLVVARNPRLDPYWLIAIAVGMILYVIAVR